MHTVVICDVLDNFGDAGFCLRLSRRICAEMHSVTLIHNSNGAMRALLGDEAIPGLDVVHANCVDLVRNIPEKVGLILHPFGSSAASADIAHVIDHLKARHSQSPWLIVDYLSAEPWVEDFHWTQSISPSSGHCSTYVYPGFTDKTGGLIHADWVEAETLKRPAENRFKKVFIFCYTPERIADLIESSNPDVHYFGVHSHPTLNHKFEGSYSTIGFCPQYQFDRRLSEHDFLFIRGEDSFVRAQLSGRPFVWQIYATSDGAHEVKLNAFFELYGANLTIRARAALWSLWQAWNGKAAPGELAQQWQRVQQHQAELIENALLWKTRLLNGPELVREILTRVPPDTLT